MLQILWVRQIWLERLLGVQLESDKGVKPEKQIRQSNQQLKCHESKHVLSGSSNSQGLLLRIGGTEHQAGCQEE